MYDLRVTTSRYLIFFVSYCVNNSPLIAFPRCPFLIINNELIGSQPGSKIFVKFCKHVHPYFLDIFISLLEQQFSYQTLLFIRQCLMQAFAADYLQVPNSELFHTKCLPKKDLRVLVGISYERHYWTSFCRISFSWRLVFVSLKWFEYWSTFFQRQKPNPDLEE